VDGIIPDCKAGKTCLIPALDERSDRVMQMRDKLVRLRDLVDAGTVLKMYGADLNDIELLAVMEDEIRKNAPAPAQQ
jgi:hypothetical protein